MAVEIMPAMRPAHENAIATRDAWMTYKETPDDKASYAVKTKAPRKESMNQVGSPTGAVEEEKSVDSDQDPFSDEGSFANSLPLNKGISHPQQ